MPILPNFPQQILAGGVTPSSQFYKSNPNLLHNWYFPAPINQRGLMEYTTTGYTIDRWSIGSSLTASLVDNGIRIVRNGVSGISFLQIIENPAVKGRNVTLTVMNCNGELYADTVQIPNTFPSSITYIKRFPIGNGLANLDIDNNGTMRVSIIPDDNNLVDLAAIKLEYGSKQTLAHQDAAGNWVLNDPPSDKALELAKCQRYFLPKAIALGEAAYSGGCFCCVNTPVTLRARPAIIGTPIIRRVSNNEKVGNLTPVVSDSEAGFVDIKIPGASELLYCYGFDLSCDL